jgi:hypothetical protein
MSLWNLGTIWKGGAAGAATVLPFWRASFLEIADINFGESSKGEEGEFVSM